MGESAPGVLCRGEGSPFRSRSRGEIYVAEDFAERPPRLTDTIFSTSQDTAATNTMTEPWRRYGEAYRKQLVKNDEESGNTVFHLHKKCRIQRYFQLADKVRESARGKDLCAPS